MLPQEVAGETGSKTKDAVILQARKARSEQDDNPTVERSQARQLSSFARQMFDAADLDKSGFLDGEELAILIQKLYKQYDVSVF